MTVHQNFTASERKHAKAMHKQQKKNQPRMFKENKDKFIRAILEAKEVNLNVARVAIL